MDLEQYTQKAQQAILSAQQIAQDMHHATIEPAHVLFALVRQSEGFVPAIINRIAGSSQLLANELEKELAARPMIHGGNGQVGLAPATAELLVSSENQAKAMKDDYVSTEHILLALAGGPEADRLRQFGITPDNILQSLAGIRGSQRVITPNPEGTYQALEKYGRDLTQDARRGRLDPVIGPDEEIRRIVQALSSRTKNNPA